MSTPVYEKEQYSFPAFETDTLQAITRSSNEAGMLQNELADEIMDRNPLRVHPSYIDGSENDGRDMRSPLSSSQVREQSQRLEDDLEMLRVERVVSETVAS